MARYYIDLPLRSVGTLTAPGLASEATLNALLVELEKKADLTETQPVSGTFSIPGVATEDKQNDQIAQLADIQTAVENIENNTPALVGGKVPVDTGLVQGLTDAELRASPVVVTANIGTIAGIATETTLSAINGKTPALGQALNAASVPVVLTATQIATLTPPAAITGFATSARQDLQTASLTSIDGKLAGTLTVTQAAPAVTQTDDTQNTDSITQVLFTKPAGAKNMVIFNNAGASVANRIRFGAAPSFASSGTGALLGVGSSTALLPASAFSVIAENTDSNANVTVIWFY